MSRERLTLPGDMLSAKAAVNEGFSRNVIDVPVMRSIEYRSEPSTAFRNRQDQRC